MNALFLRYGKPVKVDWTAWRTLADCDDMWIRLFFATAELGGWNATVQMCGKPQTTRFTPRQTLQWTERFGLDDKVDVLWVRGRYGYPPALDRHKSAYKVFLPCGSAIDVAPDRGFDLVCVDSEMQIHAAAQRFKGARIMVLPKPAIGDIFKPVRTQKDRDVVFNCHRLDDFKGYSWLVERLPAGTKVLRIGPKDRWFAAAQHLDVEWTGKIDIRDVPAQACRAKVGVVCDDGKWDSGPRILPEFLAMNIPVIVRNTVRASRMYVGPETGAWVDDNVARFQATLKYLLHDAAFMRTRDYYVDHMSLSVTANRLHRAITEDVVT